MFLKSCRAICNFFAGWDNPISSDTTVFVVSPTTFTDIFWACIKMVSKVCHSCAGASMSGGVPTHATGIGSFSMELYAHQTGTLVLFTGWLSIPSEESLLVSSACSLVSSVVSAGTLDKLCPRSHVYSCVLARDGSSCPEKR